MMSTEITETTDTKPIFSLVYVSASIKLLNDDELESMLRAWRSKNHQFNITGLLLYYEGGFMQLLEGDEAVVRSMFNTIRNDRRHRHIFRLIEDHVSERLFPDWSMAFQRLTAENTRHIEGFTHFAEAKQFVEFYKDNPQDCLIVLRGFLDRLR